jgi:hypothetical protein
MDEISRIDVAALAAWIGVVRQLCKDVARDEIGAHCIGQLLAQSPEGENGIWPSEEVCEAMEGIASPELASGFQVAVYNSRGVHWRGEGGEQERELAAKYRGWAQRLHFDYPFVGSVLKGIAVSYERDAAREDSQATIRKRLHR